MRIMTKFCAIFALAATILYDIPANSATTLLPNGQQCFTNANGALSGGSIKMYYPNTTTPKQTWQDSAQTTLNSFPITLDSNGCAIIYGTGSYRQVVYDSDSVLIWDQTTTDTSAYNDVFWAGTAAGTPNIITIIDTGFNGIDGSMINFVANATNTASTTLNPSSFGAVTIQKDTSAGPTSLSAGDIVTGNIITVVYNANDNSFHLIGSILPAPAASPTAAVPVPQGYLSLLASASGGPIQSGDVSAATAVYYEPYIGNQVPVWNGTAYVIFSFPELTLTLSASQLANKIYDVCAFSNQGTIAIGTTPAWGTVTAGSGARGTGAGTPELTRTQGLWTNANAMTVVNGASSFSVPVNQCTYLGSISMDGTNGQVTAHRTYGQSRKFGVWNAYNRAPIILQVGDSTASWAYNTATIRSSNNSASNTGAAFTGLPVEEVKVNFRQNETNLHGVSSSPALIGVGLNVTNAFSGFAGSIDSTNAAPTNVMVGAPLTASYTLAPTIGINNLNCLEKGNSTTNTFFGTNSGMVMTIEWNG